MSNPVTKFKDHQPLKTLAKAAQSCSAQVTLNHPSRGEQSSDPQSITYGSCIGKSYKEVSKDMCQAEFQAFKDCVQVSTGSMGWFGHLSFRSSRLTSDRVCTLDRSHHRYMSSECRKTDVRNRSDVNGDLNLRLGLYDQIQSH